MKKLFCFIVSVLLIKTGISQNIFLQKFNQLPTYSEKEIQKDMTYTQDENGTHLEVTVRSQYGLDLY